MSQMVYTDAMTSEHIDKFRSLVTSSLLTANERSLTMIAGAVSKMISGDAEGIIRTDTSDFEFWSFLVVRLMGLASDARFAKLHDAFREDVISLFMLSLQRDCTLFHDAFKDILTLCDDLMELLVLVPQTERHSNYRFVPASEVVDITVFPSLQPLFGSSLSAETRTLLRSWEIDTAATCLQKMVSILRILCSLLDRIPPLSTDEVGSLTQVLQKLLIFYGKTVREPCLALLEKLFKNASVAPLHFDGVLQALLITCEMPAHGSEEEITRADETLGRCLCLLSKSSRLMSTVCLSAHRVVTCIVTVIRRTTCVSLKEDACKLLHVVLRRCDATLFAQHPALMDDVQKVLKLVSAYSSTQGAALACLSALSRTGGAVDSASVTTTPGSSKKRPREQEEGTGVTPVISRGMKRLRLGQDQPDPSATGGPPSQSPTVLRGAPRFQVTFDETSPQAEGILGKLIQESWKAVPVNITPGDTITALRLLSTAKTVVQACLNHPQKPGLQTVLQIFHKWSRLAINAEYIAAWLPEGTGMLLAMAEAIVGTVSEDALMSVLDDINLLVDVPMTIVHGEGPNSDLPAHTPAANRARAAMRVITACPQGGNDTRMRVCLRALIDARAAVAAAAAEGTPEMARRCGHEMHQILCQKLLELAALHTKQRNGPVVQAVLIALGGMACISATMGTPNIPRLEYRLIKHQLICITPLCAVCDSGAKPALVASYPSLAHMSPWIFDLFEATQSSNVKRALLACLTRFVRHTDPTSLRDAIPNFSKVLVALEDPVYDVRIDAGRLAKALVVCNDGAVGADLSAIVYRQLKSTSASTMPEILETVLLMVGELGTVVTGEKMQVALYILVDHLVHRDLVVRGIAYEQVARIATSRGLTIPELMQSHRQQLCPYMVDRLISNPAVVSEVATSLFELPLHEFLFMSLPFTLPHLIINDSQHLLGTLQQVLECTLTDLVSTHLHHIVCYTLTEQKHKLPEVMTTLQVIFQWDYARIFDECLTEMLNEFVKRLGSEKEKILPALKLVAWNKHHRNAEGISGNVDTSNVSLGRFLDPYVLGILDSINRTLLEKGPVEEKIAMLASFEELLLVMGGNHLGAVRHKIMGTLKFALEDRQLTRHACNVWRTFIRTIGVENIGPLLSPICTILAAHVRVATEEVAGLLHYLIVVCRTQLRGHFGEVLFLDDHPALAEVNQVLQDERGQQSLKDRLTTVVRGLQHESWNVRNIALGILRNLIRSNRVEIFEMLLTDEGIAVVNVVMKQLLLGTREVTKTARIKYAECLGELGAIDPSRLDFKLTEGHEEDVKESSDEDFAIDLIKNYLIRDIGDLTSHKAQDRVSYTIQELLLKVLRLKEVPGKKGTPQVQPTHLWEAFTPEARSVLRPYLHTKYKIGDKQAEKEQRPIVGVVFSSSEVVDYRDWLSKWAQKLLQSLNGPTASLFSACRLILKDNINIAMTLLPRLLRHTISLGNDDVNDGILQEMLAVLQPMGRPAAEAYQDVNIELPRVDDVHSKRVELHQMAAQTVFSMVNQLSRYHEQKSRQHQMHQLQQASAVRNRSGLAIALTSSEMGAVTNLAKLLPQIPHSLLAAASFRHKAYTRALLHVEMAWRKPQPGDPNADDRLNFMQRILAALDDGDGILGVSASRDRQPALEEEIVDMKTTGRWVEAQSCYELALQRDPFKIEYHSGLLECLRNVGHFETMLAHVRGVLSEVNDRDFLAPLNTFGVEAAWRLGRWDVLEDFQSQPCKEDFEVDIGRILLAMRNNDTIKFSEQLASSRLNIVGSLVAASMESYARAHPFLIRLQMLRELEEAFAYRPGDNPKPMLKAWNAQLAIMQPFGRTKEPVLVLRQLMCGLCGLTDEEGQNWLRIAESARLAGHHQTSYAAVLQASALKATNVNVERAKLAWDQGQTKVAMNSLEREIVERKAQLSATGPATNNRELSKLNLLIAQWYQNTEKKQAEILHRFKEVTETDKQWEEGHFYFASYEDTLLQLEHKNLQYTDKEYREKGKPNVTFKAPQLHERYLRTLIEVLRGYGRSLCYGSAHIYQSLPRLLTIWLDFYDSPYIVYILSQKKKKESREGPSHLDEAGASHIIQECIQHLIQKMPVFHWMTALPQIISRMCHQHSVTASELNSILQLVIAKYPQQGFWAMAGVSNSTVKARNQRANDILHAVCKEGELRDLHRNFSRLSDYLIAIADYKINGDNVTSISLKSDMSRVPRVEDTNIILPFESALIPTMPLTVSTGTANNSDHNPYPNAPTTIIGIKDEVEILPSLIKPKKVTFRASDGKEYFFLCKPKDDLRRDSRVMEVQNLLNKLLKKDPEARRRNLALHTYAVIPLNEECGVIEWVRGTRGLRPIILDEYKSSGIPTPHSNQVKELYKKKDKLLEATPKDKKEEVAAEWFTNTLLPLYKPVLHRWFLATFPEPTAWYNARMRFARSTAVMSITGNIIGLGDRHGENILLDAATGECVHVDLNCIFWKGQSFEIAERVPFRLTQNMVDAYGPTGVEGTFRRVCEITMRIVRANRDSLLSVMQSFVYDPLVDWQNSKSAQAETKNEQAVAVIDKVRDHLEGHVSGVVPLSVESQVRKLIEDATSPENLALMYIGWAPFY